MPANDVSDPEISVLQGLLEEYRGQYNIADGKLDRTKVEHLYKRDADFTAFDIAPPLGGYIGWDVYAAAWYKVLNKYSQINFTFRDDVRIFREGDVAWMSFSPDWFGKSAAGDDFHKEMRMTLVWVRKDGQWQITHEHGSSPRETTLAGGEVV